MSSDKQVESINPASSNPAERRRNLRFPFTATVEVIETKSGTKTIGRTSDLSFGGCYVDTLSPFPVGTDAKVRILRENESFEGNVKVVYSTIGMGMGLVFVSAQPKQVRLFQKWLLEISGQPAQEEANEGTASQYTTEKAPAERTQTLHNVVLSDLIMTLMQKKFLTQGEGKDMLRKLFR